MAEDLVYATDPADRYWCTFVNIVIPLHLCTHTHTHTHKHTDARVASGLKGDEYGVQCLCVHPLLSVLEVSWEPSAYIQVVQDNNNVHKQDTAPQSNARIHSALQKCVYNNIVEARGLYCALCTRCAQNLYGNIHKLDSTA